MSKASSRLRVVPDKETLNSSFYAQRRRSFKSRILL